MVKKRLQIVLAVLFGAIYCAILFLPYPVAVGEGNEYVLCKWEDGTVTEESFAAVNAAFLGISKAGDILLGRDGREGTVETSGQFRDACRVLEEGETAEIMSLAPSVNRFERSALFLAFADRIYYDEGEMFSFTGERCVDTEVRPAKEFVLLGGSVPNAILRSVFPDILYVRGRAELEPLSLIGTGVTVVAGAPYVCEGGAVYLETAVGRRLVCGQPCAEEIVCSDYLFADEGAFLPCFRLRSVDIPFAGSSRSSAGEEYRGEFAHLFSQDNAYLVPETLEYVRVRGGILGATAFYACPSVKEVDTCGISAEDIEEQAFDGLTGLRRLHTAKDFSRKGFSEEMAPCGCTIYTRIGETL